jgi:hypothetical protein
MKTVQIAAIVVRTERITVSCRFASVPFDNVERLSHRADE